MMDSKTMKYNNLPDYDIEIINKEGKRFVKLMDGLISEDVDVYYEFLSYQKICTKLTARQLHGIKKENPSTPRCDTKNTPNLHPYEYYANYFDDINIRKIFFAIDKIKNCFLRLCWDYRKPIDNFYRIDKLSEKDIHKGLFTFCIIQKINQIKIDIGVPLQEMNEAFNYAKNKYGYDIACVLFKEVMDIFQTFELNLQNKWKFNIKTFSFYSIVEDWFNIKEKYFDKSDKGIYPRPKKDNKKISDDKLKELLLQCKNDRDKAALLYFLDKHRYYPVILTASFYKRISELLNKNPKTSNYRKFIPRIFNYYNTEFPREAVGNLYDQLDTIKKIALKEKFDDIKNDVNDKIEQLKKK